MDQIEKLSDSALTDRLSELAREESSHLAELIRHLMEFDRRRVYLELGYSSLYTYCVQALRFSDAAAYRRIRAARISRQWPRVIDLLASRELHLESISLISPYLEETKEAERLIDAACGKRVREVEFLIASLFPSREIRDVVRAIPAPPPAPQIELTPSGDASEPQSASPAPSGLGEDSAWQPLPRRAPPPPREESVKPVSDSRIRFAFTADSVLLERLQRARDLLRHKFPTGRMEDLILETIEFFLDAKDPDRRTTAERPDNAGGPPRRRVPQWVKDEVWQRDGGRCAYVARDGKICGERGALEYDHIVPWALGGPSNDPRNVRLLCRAHNQHAARSIFGG